MKSHAFTLIELLVVVLIIGILSAIALPQYTKSVDKTRATEVLLKMKALHVVTSTYQLANGNNALKEGDGYNIGVEVLGECSQSSGSSCFVTCPSAKWSGCFYDNYGAGDIEFYFNNGRSQIRFYYNGKEFSCTSYEFPDDCKIYGFTRKEGNNYYQ